MNLDDLGGDHGDEDENDPEELIYRQGNLMDLVGEDDSIAVLDMAINLAEKSFFFKTLPLEKRIEEVKRAYDALNDILYNDGADL